MEEQQHVPLFVEVKHYEDAKGRTVFCKLDGAQIISFGGQCIVAVDNQPITMTFAIEAQDVFEAFEKFDGTAKLAFETQMKKVQAQQRKAAILGNLRQAPANPNGKIIKLQ